jgi:hypothetical protein
MRECGLEFSGELTKLEVKQNEFTFENTCNGYQNGAGSFSPSMVFIVSWRPVDTWRETV